MLSPLYRIKSVSEKELSDGDDFLIQVKHALGGDKEKAGRFEKAWQSHGKSKEQIEKFL